MVIAIKQRASSWKQGYGAGAKAILDGWSQSQKLLDGGVEAWKLGSGSTALVCGASRLYK